MDSSSSCRIDVDCGLVEAGGWLQLKNDVTQKFQTFVFTLEASPLVGTVDQIILIYQINLEMLLDHEFTPPTSQEKMSSQSLLNIYFDKCEKEWLIISSRLI
jgi:hypothetical protein